jgi:hypothetical protein
MQCEGLFDHLVGDSKQVRQNGEAGRFGGLKIDRQFVLILAI